MARGLVASEQRSQVFKNRDGACRQFSFCIAFANDKLRSDQSVGCIDIGTAGVDRCSPSLDCFVQG